MLGLLVWNEARGRRVYAERSALAGLPLFRVELSRERGFLGLRLRRACHLMARQGIGRVLVPDGFDRWAVLRDYGLGPVDCLPFLRAVSGEILLAALRKAKVDPKRATVALRARRTERDMVLCAQTLAPFVRELVISAPVGGEELRRWLQREWGMAPRPDGPGVEGVVRLDETAGREGGVVISLFEGEVDLAGIIPTLAGEEMPRETARLPLLAALWQAGKLDGGGLEFEQ